MVDFIPRSMQSTGMTCKSDLCQLGVVILDLFSLSLAQYAGIVEMPLFT